MCTAPVVFVNVDQSLLNDYTHSSLDHLHTLMPHASDHFRHINYSLLLHLCGVRHFMYYSVYHVHHLSPLVPLVSCSPLYLKRPPMCACFIRFTLDSICLLFDSSNNHSDQYYPGLPAHV